MKICKNNTELRIDKLRRRYQGCKTLAYAHFGLGLLGIFSAVILQRNELFYSRQLWSALFILALGAGWLNHYETVKVFDEYLISLETNELRKPQ